MVEVIVEGLSKGSELQDEKLKTLSPYNRRLAYYYRNKEKILSANNFPRRVAKAKYRKKNRDKIIAYKREYRARQRSIGPLFDYYGVINTPVPPNRQKLVQEALGEHLKKLSVCPCCKQPVEPKLNLKKLQELVSPRALENRPLIGDLFFKDLIQGPRDELLINKVKKVQKELERKKKEFMKTQKEIKKRLKEIEKLENSKNSLENISSSEVLKKPDEVCN